MRYLPNYPWLCASNTYYIWQHGPSAVCICSNQEEEKPSGDSVRYYGTGTSTDITVTEMLNPTRFPCISRSRRSNRRIYIFWPTITGHFFVWDLGLGLGFTVGVCFVAIALVGTSNPNLKPKGLGFGPKPKPSNSRFGFWTWPWRPNGEVTYHLQRCISYVRESSILQFHERFRFLGFHRKSNFIMGRAWS
jgi:hypothetical protein